MMKCNINSAIITRCTVTNIRRQKYYDNAMLINAAGDVATKTWLSIGPIVKQFIGSFPRHFPDTRSISRLSSQLSHSLKFSSFFENIGHPAAAAVNVRRSSCFDCFQLLQSVRSRVSRSPSFRPYLDSLFAGSSIRENFLPASVQ